MIYLVTSKFAHVGKTTFSVDFAKSNEKSLLVDIDFRGSRTIYNFEHQGFIDYINGNCPMDEMLIHCADFDYIFPSKDIIKSAQINIFDTSSFQQILSLPYKNIIFDSAPFTMFLDSKQALPFCDEVIFVENKESPLSKITHKDISWIQDKKYRIITKEIKPQAHFEENILVEEILKTQPNLVIKKGQIV